MARSIQFSPSAFEEYIAWRKLDDDIVEKINALILDIARDPFKGIGKPEPLKGDYHAGTSSYLSSQRRCH